MVVMEVMEVILMVPLHLTLEEAGGSGGSAGAAISGSHTLSNSGTINGST